MGVPTFYRWIFDHYRKIILTRQCPHGKSTHLYLDMNCGIHPAVKSRPMTVDEMPQAVIDYLDNIISIVRPTKLVYIAIDGVAPRAKMNQQRKRRFKVIKEKADMNQLKRKYGDFTVDNIHNIDFNMISPGTQFMYDVSKRIRSHIRTQINRKDSYWYGLDVVYSDSTVPGEGEHKIMRHIRGKCTDDDKIVVYGMDSDLIFLCMSNYRPNICLFRENVQLDKNNEVDGYIFLAIGALMDKLLDMLTPAMSLARMADSHIFTDKIANSLIQRNQAIITGNVMSSTPGNVTYDNDRIIADYTTICFFLGNDFLPPLTSLKIRSGGLDQVIFAYKLLQCHYPDDPYLTLNHRIEQHKLITFLSILSDIETTTLKEDTIGREQRIKRFLSSYKYRVSHGIDRECLRRDMVELTSTDL